MLENAFGREVAEDDARPKRNSTTIADGNLKESNDCNE